jgi:hypothetical protein
MTMPSPILPFLRPPRRASGRGLRARLLVGIWLAVHALVALGLPVADGMLGSAGSAGSALGLRPAPPGAVSVAHERALDTQPSS